MKKTLFVLFLVVPAMLVGQKKALDHSDYDSWKNLSSAKITDDGNFISYEINPQQGDGMLYLYDRKNAASDLFERGNNASFSPGMNYFVYSIVPPYAETRQAKQDKKKPDEMPKNKLGIKMLGSDETTLIERVKSFKMPEDEGNWMAYLKEKSLPEKKEKEEAEEKEEEQEEAKAPARGRRGGGNNGAEGTELIIINPVEGVEHSVNDVVEYEVAGMGTAVSYVQVKTDTAKVEHYTVSVFDTKTQESTEIFNGDGKLKNLTLFKDGSRLSFIYSPDTSEVKIYDLYLWDGNECSEIVDMETAGMTEGWSVSENGRLEFSESGERLFFGTAEKPVEEPEDTLLAEEKYKLDIWSWHDPLLQPQQKVQLQREQNKSYEAVYHLNKSTMVQLATEDIPQIRTFLDRDGDIVVGISDLKYRKLTSWDASRYSDYYLVDINTGESKLILEKAPSSVEFSPSGENMLFWCIKSKSWKSRKTAGGDVIDLTAGLDVKFYNERHDTPSEPRPYGVIDKWIEGEKYVLIYDHFDIWKFDVSGSEEPELITNGYGRKNNIFFRHTDLTAGGGFRGFGRSSDDKKYLEPRETIYLTALNEENKESGLFKTSVNKTADPDKIIMEACSFRSFTKAEENDIVIFQRETFEDYPDLYVSGLRFEDPLKISETNPQQDEYIWGTSELVEWKSFDGQKLQGILYKPENFDPSKKYPMIVYFYELSSDGLYRHYTPAPSASTINRIYAVSNGYLVFVPDIPYVEGYPGQSCYNAVVSGTYALLERYDFIDRTKLGLDGQSWGGYQIAYLITQTDLYACAFSGAPVSNMTSAYGGIRWGSGMSRMFQYEQTQSRIGGTLWEKPIHYIENSPIFFVPKINTPVLIMHNDADGAVPWYQGIEFFVALRRLEKPAWMLSYNDEEHNLTKRPNRKDLSVRKMQFFDHYLQDAPMPYWMKEGISQIEKGKKDGYELMK
ncbi:MAG: prolyl oligopeptidase family serine peptidase [Bacteroidales bacterium]|nr:prolyl oligopeptidase family serine peptidase [Bacteroidales bacterium]